MGINSLLQQDMQGAGLAGIDRLAGNAMFPQSQMDKTQYSVSSQMPTSAEVVNAGYEPKNNAYTGMPMQSFAQGGITSLAVGGSAEEKQAALARAYKAVLGRDVDESAQQWLGDLDSGSEMDLANRLAQTEEGKAYGASNPKDVYANMVALSQENSPFKGVETPVDYSGLKYVAGAQDAEGNPTHIFQDKDSGVLTVDAAGNPVSYNPGAGWYDEQLKNRPDALRGMNYRNQTYLASGPLEKTYNFQGIDVPISAEEYQVDRDTGQFVKGETGEYVPLKFKDPDYNMMDDWGYIASVPLIPLAVSYAAPYLAGEAALTAAATEAGGATVAGEAALTAAATEAGGATVAGSGGLGAMGPTYAELGYTGLANGAMGPTYAELGFTGLNQAQAIAAADAASKTAGAGMTAKQAYAAKTGLDMLNSGLSGGSQPQTTSGPQTVSAPATIPTVNRFGVTGYQGQVPTSEFQPKPIMMSKIRGVGGDYTFAQGGIAQLGSYSDGGQLLRGPGDGMSDNIPAKIGEAQPARLADGEFVVPADVVSHLGNGSTDAGAKQLYSMMDKIRKARTGTKKQGKQINPSKYLP